MVRDNFLAALLTLVWATSKSTAQTSFAGVLNMFEPDKRGGALVSCSSQLYGPFSEVHSTTPLNLSGSPALSMTPEKKSDLKIKPNKEQDILKNRIF